MPNGSPIRLPTFAPVALAVLAALAVGAPAARAQAGPAERLSASDRALADEIFEELVEIPSVSETPETVRAAEAMAARLAAAGFADEDVRVVTLESGAGQLLARYRGADTGEPPILLMAHLDVVDARPEDWSTDPFERVEADGWWYGRGTTDNKAGAAILIANFLRWRAAGWVPDRDLIVLLTGDEETSSGGVKWAVTEGLEWMGAKPALALNTDAGGGQLGPDGAELMHGVQTSEKVYLTFRLETTNPGGHSSRPRPDNAIYALAAGLGRLAEHRFPIVLNETTRAFFERSAAFEADPATAADMRAAAAEPPDLEAAERLAAASSYHNALLRTTCVATRLEAGHADNALPQTARATVNCRVLPGQDLDAVDAALARVLDDPAIAIARVNDPTPSPPSPLAPDVMGPIETLTEEFWPGVPVVPVMSTGATDGLYARNAGIPVYGVAAIFEDPEDARAHGRDERIEIDRYFEALEFWRRMVEAVAGR